ncbi:hypothetical protein [Mesorhizobium sp. IMUNJ 23232]|uniref:hypothetical protein n=1 Tax=Mesorhizobium sp. IMUNJ 23232 TaxID=3376064 RepID=UPI003797ACB0
MAGGVHTIPAGVQDGTAIPAVAKVSANTRVMAQTGPLSIATDVLTFPGPSTVGNWLASNQRTLVNGVPTIAQSSVGQAIVPGPPPVPSPAVVTTADPRVKAM